MKKILQDILISSTALFITASYVKGLHIESSFETFLIAGLVLVLGDYILRPIIGILTLPFSFLTLGIFSSVINAIVLYVLTLLYPKIQITGFQFDGLNFVGFSLPSFYVSTILSYYVISVIIYSLRKIILWIFSY